MSGSGDRIRHIRGSRSREEFATYLGVHKNTLANYERDDRAPDAATLTRLVGDGFNANWILTGEGEMYVSRNEAPVQQEMLRDVIGDDSEARLRRDKAFEARARYSMGMVARIHETIADSGADLAEAQLEQVKAAVYKLLMSGDASEFVEVPLYDVEAAAGYGSLVTNEEIKGHYAFRRDFIRDKGWNPSDLALITGRGDSMPGVIEDGQLVLLNLSIDSVESEGIYVVRLDDHIVIKALQGDHRGNIYIRSTNSLYREIVVPKEERDDLEVIGRAVWTDKLL